MKVKVFRFYSPSKEEMEEEMNKWLAMNKIRLIETTTTTSNNYSYFILFYEPSQDNV